MSYTEPDPEWLKCYTDYRDQMIARMSRPALPPHIDELHITIFKSNGHEMSVDCWCEPSQIVLTRNQLTGSLVLVVIHEDEVAEQHLLTLSKRERDINAPCADFHTDTDWITRTLEHVCDHDQGAA